MARRPVFFVIALPGRDIGRVTSWSARPSSNVGETQPPLSRLEAGGVVPTIPLPERISADLVVELARHAA